jgi:hypothetical protein
MRVEHLNYFILKCTHRLFPNLPLPLWTGHSYSDSCDCRWFTVVVAELTRIVSILFLIEMIGTILLAKVSEGLVGCFDLERR